MKQLDFLAIGDIVCEPFIRLKEAEVHCEKGAGKCEICMSWGDKIPYDYAVFMPAVGNSANAAVSAARLGLAAGLRAYVGDDRNGKECMDRLAEEHVDTEYMVTEPGKNTNYHYVLWFQDDRTILVKHEDFSYSVPDLTSVPKWVYLSSLAANSLAYHQDLVKMLEANPEIRLAFQPGTFQMSLGVQALKGLYERCTFFVCNREEAGRILETDDLKDIRGLLVGLYKLGPKTVVITDGTNGAYAFDGFKMLFVPMYPDTRGPFERTGAGDAFASTVVAAMALGEPFEKALLWGPINSMSVVQEVGAQQGLLTRAQLLEFLQNAPSSYAIREL
jgi:sugar/nucleoside kinase (ribokinase family)